jgi:hypothetical protein
MSPSPVRSASPGSEQSHYSGKNIQIYMIEGIDNAKDITRHIHDMHTILDLYTTQMSHTNNNKYGVCWVFKQNNK